MGMRAKTDANIIQALTGERDDALYARDRAEQREQAARGLVDQLQLTIDRMGQEADGDQTFRDGCREGWEYAMRAVVLTAMREGANLNAEIARVSDDDPR